MERDHHLTQDAAEVYAVAVMQRVSENLGIAGTRTAGKRMEEFENYLKNCGLTRATFETGLYGRYKTNVDQQIPAFVRRLGEHFLGGTLDFRNDEAAMRVRGLKGDFLISVGTEPEEIAVSLKNYIGGGGITRPQVSSGTFLSFACGFVFDRVGVGQYADPHKEGRVFRGSDAISRNVVLSYQGRTQYIKPLDHLEQLQLVMRTELLGRDCEMYDRARVRSVVERIAQPGIDTVLHIFDLLRQESAPLGEDIVRDKFLARIGLDGKEESLFFDAERYVDSITNPAYHDLRERVNDAEFTVAQHRQSIRFSFSQGASLVLKADVPFTINTNGAWYRPKPKYSGVRIYNDKGHPVELRWGQRRPYKSMEIATSTNTYLDLAKVGIFGT
jgi:hypothetical protein